MSRSYEMGKIFGYIFDNSHLYGNKAKLILFHDDFLTKLLKISRRIELGGTLFQFFRGRAIHYCLCCIFLGISAL